MPLSRVAYRIAKNNKNVMKRNFFKILFISITQFKNKENETNNFHFKLSSLIKMILFSVITFAFVLDV